MKLTKSFLAELKFTAFHFPIVSVGLLAAAVASLWFAGITAKEFTTSSRTSTMLENDQPGLVKLQKRPVSAPEVESLMDILRQNHPGLEISTSPVAGTLVIAAASPENYREWISALGTIQGAGKAGSVWLATEICVSACGTVALRAEVQGLNQSIGKGG